MPEILAPVAGTLTAVLIRACRVHTDCPLECPERDTVDLGEVASFDHRPKEAPDVVTGH